MKQIKYTLNTGAEERTNTVTKTITGYLKAIILNTMGADIKIYLREYPQVTIFDRRNVQTVGWEYMPLAVQMDTGHKDNKEKFTFNAVDWALNDELVIEVSGKKGTIVNLVLRYE